MAIIILRLISSILLATSVSGFSPSATQPAKLSRVSSSKTQLFISSWGTKGSPYTSARSVEHENIEENLQAYLKEPEAVEARANIDGTVMVSGLVKSKERTDQTIFDLLNHEDSAFEFDKIVAFVDDMKFAKKRLLSRSARYTGLLDKLDFKEAASAGDLPTAADLEGVKSWIAFIDATDDKSKALADVEAIAGLAKASPSVENVAILLAGANDIDEAASKKALESLQGDNSLSYTLVAVGKIEEHAEGSFPYRYAEFGSEEGVLPETCVYSRDESLRLVTELLQLECGVNKALTFREVYNVNITEARLVKGLREAGYARPQEIDHMIRDGPKKYKEAVKEWKTKNPDAAKGYTSDAWWESEQFQKSVRERARKNEAEIQLVKDTKQEEIEKIATEWAKREFYRVSTSAEGTELKEEDFIKEIWDRALFEGDLKYRELKGEDPDAEAELADFKAQQERKKEVMLKRAKKELREVLDAESLGGDDIPGLSDEEPEGNPDLDDKKNY